MSISFINPGPNASRFTDFYNAFNNNSGEIIQAISNNGNQINLIKENGDILSFNLPFTKDVKVSGIDASISGSPGNYNADYTAGEYQLNNNLVSILGGTFALTVPTPGNDRIDLVHGDSLGNVQLIQGVEAPASPAPPAIPANNILLFYVYYPDAGLPFIIDGTGLGQFVPDGVNTGDILYWNGTSWQPSGGSGLNNGDILRWSPIGWIGNNTDIAGTYMIYGSTPLRTNDGTFQQIVWASADNNISGVLPIFIAVTTTSPPFINITPNYSETGPSYINFNINLAISATAGDDPIGVEIQVNRNGTPLPGCTYYKPIPNGATVPFEMDVSISGTTTNPFFNTDNITADFRFVYPAGVFTTDYEFLDTKLQLTVNSAI